jgi:hypothetical protein
VMVFFCILSPISCDDHAPMVRSMHFFSVFCLQFHVTGDA